MQRFVQLGWPLTVILALGRQKQENYKFKASLGYFVTSQPVLVIRNIFKLHGGRVCCSQACAVEVVEEAQAADTAWLRSAVVLESRVHVGVGPCGSGGEERWWRCVHNTIDSPSVF